MIRPEDIKYCQKIMNRHGVSYSFASRWLPAPKRAATAIMYAFFRVPDDLVDAAGTNKETKTTSLVAWCELWREAQMNKPVKEPVLRAAREIFLEYKIPFEYGDDFLKAMLQDLTQERYPKYSDLEAYMYGSAAVVGLIMTHIIGFKDEKTLTSAKALGEAMQLTNFLRDIKEDYEDRRRIYLPLEDMARFGVTEDTIKNHELTPAFIELMRFEINRARDLYALAEAGIDDLSADGRFAVRLASRLYSAILIKIEQAGYDVFKKRAKTTKLEKITILYYLWRSSKNTQ